MGVTRRRAASSAVLAGLLAFSLASHARAGDPQTAEALYQSAREAMARGDLEKACPQFAESQRLDPATGTLLNLAECEERSGKLATALAHFQEGHDELPPGDYRLPFTLDKIAKLNRRVPRLVIRASVPVETGMAVLRDDTELGPASLGVPLPVDPGNHVCALRIPGHADARAEITLAEGDTKTVQLVPGPRIAESGAPGGALGDGQRTWAYVAGSAGLAGLVVGGIFGVTAKLTYQSALSKCPGGPTMCGQSSVSGGQTAYTEATVSDVGFIAGGALLATGVTLFLTAPKRQSLTVAPAVGAGEAGIRVSGAW
jgi:hypothetical protein